MLMPRLLELPNLCILPVLAHLRGLPEWEPEVLQKIKGRVYKFLHSPMQG